MGRKKSGIDSDQESSLLEVTRRSAGDSAIARKHSLANGRTAVNAIGRRRKRKEERWSRRTRRRGKKPPYGSQTRTPQISDAITMSFDVFLELAGRRFIRVGPTIGEQEISLYGTGIEQDKAKPQR
jgi:hypothetical protein